LTDQILFYNIGTVIHSVSGTINTAYFVIELFAFDQHRLM